MAELWYHGGGVDIGLIVFDGVVTPASFGGDEKMLNKIVVATSDLTAGESTIFEAHQSNVSFYGASTGGPGYKYIFALMAYVASIPTSNYRNTYSFQNPKIFGRHGLAFKGTWPNIGFSADQIVVHIVSKANDIAARRIDSFAYVIPQFTVETATTPKDAIPQVNAFANADYGTWGPDSPLDNSINGYFDYKQPDTATQHWFASRADFEGDLGFHTELSSLYDAVDVHWADEAGADHTERFSIFSPDLREANLSPRVAPLDAGTTTKAGAQILAEIFLDIFAGFAPARGSGTVSGKVRHYRRGKLPAYYMRADGSNLRIPDILPAETAFSLDSTPDRRTTFPIKRVSVDCSGDVPRTSVEFDQSTEALSVLLAQEAAQAELVG
jgi:hypothetical protein